MIKKNRKLTLILVFLLCSISLSAYIVSAGGGNAGVGVMNVPPNYASIDIYPQDNTIRAYLTLSDYNSWMDIHKVQVNLEENGVVLYSFIYQQYSDPETFQQLNTFSDLSETPILVTEACNVEHSQSTKTIQDRCQLDLRFVFKTTYFSKLHIISTDRAGDSTEIWVEYKGSDMTRNENILLIPWIGGSFKLEFPPFTLDILIVIIATIATIIIGRKTPIATALQQVIYESE